MRREERLERDCAGRVGTVRIAAVMHRRSAAWGLCNVVVEPVISCNIESVVVSVYLAPSKQS